MADITVLIPVDLSVSNTNTLNFGLFAAKKWGWKLHLLDVFTSETALEEAMQEVLARIHRQHPSIQIDGESIRGNVVEAILAKPSLESYALVILEADEIKEWGYQLLGEQSFDFMEHCTIPVLALPARYEIRSFGRLGILTDFQELEMNALRLLVDVFGQSMAWLIFHVFQDKEEEANRQRQLQEWELDIKGNVTLNAIKFQLAYTDDIRTGIAHIIRREKLDLLVLTAVSKSFLKRLFSKDYFKQFVSHPLLKPTLFIKCN